MYQEVLDVLNANKTAGQHEKALQNLYSRATDTTLKQFIQDVGILVSSVIKAMSAKVKNKNLTALERKVAAEAAKEDKAKKFILADSLDDRVKKLITYCQSQI